MNKMKKLLSVILALVLALSCMSIAASAAKTSYKTVDDLKALGAYSPYGQVTRLSTEERSSILLDFLDSVLPGLNINMGTVLDVLGLTITIDFTSVDAMLGSLDSFADTFDNTLFSIAAGIVSLGILEELEFDTWATGMTRAGTDQYTILSEIFELLGANGAVVEAVLSDGLDLGIVASFLGSLDLSGINEIITDLPGMVKSMILPMFERWDDTAAEAVAMEGYQDGSNTTTAFSTILSTLIGNYFSKPMSLTTVKADSTGKITSDHTLPGDLSAASHRRIYVQNGTEIVVYQYYFQTDVDKDETDNITTVGYGVVGTYTAQEEYPGVEGTDYVFVMTKDANGEAVENGENLKYYENDSYWLASFVEAGGSVNINSESASVLLYKMIPYVFGEMAPTVVNGSLKKLLAGFFGMQWTNLGDINELDTSTIIGYDANLEVFGEQGDYLWEWSAFDVVTVDGVDYYYYRYEDQFFIGDASNCNEYMEIINWDYEITADFLNEFIPVESGSNTIAAGTAVSPAGYTRILHGVNDFLVKLATEVLDLETLDITLTKGDNSKLIGNIKTVAQTIVDYAPEHIFGVTTDSEGNESYGSYYDLFMSEDNDTVLVGIAAFVIDAIAPQMHLPSADSLVNQDITVGALLAAMLRELATQLVPSIDYDALIYSDYNAGKFVSGKDNSYWLDVLLTIGTDIGYKYLTAFADMNEELLADGFAKDGYIDWSLDRTYEEDDLKLDSDVNLWEQRVDFIIDWALYVDNSGGVNVWNMANLVGNYVGDFNYAKAEDPWAKVDAIFDNILFFDQFTSETDLETALRGTILDLVNLKWENILGTESEKGIFDIPATSKLRTNSLLSALSLEIRDLINGLFKDVGGGSYYLIPESITTIDALLNQSNITTIAKGLIEALDDAFNNGLLVTVLPILNFFIGWKTDPQVLADPVIWTSFRDGNDYMFIWTGDSSYPTINTSYIYFLNNSSGMLETHRDSEVVDHEYAIQITSVTSNAKSNTVTFDYGDGYVSPYEQLAIAIGGTYTADEAFTITIAYNYLGKDGVAVGGTQYKSIPVFMSNLYEDAQLFTAATDKSDSTYREGYSTYIFTEDIYTTVTETTGTVVLDNSLLWSVTSNLNDLKAPDTYTQTVVTGTDSCGDDVTEDVEVAYTAPSYNQYGETYFGMYQLADGQWPSSMTAESSSTASSSGKFFYAKSGYDATTEYPNGIYAFPQIAVKYGSSSKTWNYVFIKYNDYDVYETYTTYKDNNYTVNDVDTTDEDAVAAYNRYEAALQNITRLATYPMMTTASGASSSVDYVTAIMPQIEAAQAEMIEAAEALEEYMAAAQANASADAEALPKGAQLIADELAKDADPEINYQDYRYYEYFNYADIRTAARNLMKTYTAPEVLVGGYIEGSGISYAELTGSVIPAETNTNISTGITNTITYYTEEEIAASQQANDDFVQPYNTYLYLADFASRLAYYRGFLEDVSANKVAADTTFISREISYAEANYPTSDEDLYTEASWARYIAAYNAAKAITGSELPSVVFSTKYELMVAMKNLLLKSKSANENGAIDNLIALVADANAIFALSYDEIELSEEAIAAGMTKDEALGHLIRAVGYYYTGEDENTWNLYADSALEYIDNDRPNKTTNLAKIAATESNLSAAIAYFDMGEEAAPELGAIDGTTGAFGEVTTDEETGLVTGYIYGVTAGDDAEDYFALVDDTTGTVEWTASEGGATNGTGAVATVKDNAGNTVAIYTLVVFGDVNGDAAITAADGNTIKSVALGGSIEAGARELAADVNGDASITAADGNTVKSAALGGNITVNPY